MHIYVYIYIHMCIICVYIYIYIYIYVYIGPMRQKMLAKREASGDAESAVLESGYV